MDAVSCFDDISLGTYALDEYPLSKHVNLGNLLGKIMLETENLHVITVSQLTREIRESMQKILMQQISVEGIDGN